MKKTFYLAPCVAMGIFVASSVVYAYTDGDNIDERIAPVAGYVGTFTNPNSVKKILSGKEVYEGTCASCHKSGASGAPRMGNNEEWAPRISEGIESAYNNALKGLNAMPAKGGNPALSDFEVKSAVHYMMNASGGSFPKPEKK